MTRLLVRLGIPVKKQTATAAAKQMAGRQRDEDDSNEEWPDSDEEWPDDEDEDEAKAKDENGEGASGVGDGHGDNANADGKKEKKTPKSSSSIDIDALFTAIAAISDNDEAATMKQHYERCAERNAANGV
jgi:hypothetical protein